MPKPNHIERVTLTVETANGELHQMVVHRPSPGGDNPAFMAQQFDGAVIELDRRMDDLIESQYGRQVRKSEQSA